MIKLSDVLVDRAKTPFAVRRNKPSVIWRATGENQAAYRIGVAKSRYKAINGQFDVYDSGVTESGETIGHAVGAELEPCTTYYVSVTIYGENGGEDSAVVRFRTELSAEDWKGYWTFMPLNSVGGSSLYRKNIVLPDEPVEEAFAYCAGIGCHELFVNGKKADDRLFSPVNSDYEKRIYYTVYELTGRLVAGENVIGVELAPWWYGGKKFLFQLYVTLKNGETLEFHSSAGDGWWERGGAVKECSVYDGEFCDGRVEDEFLPHWASADYRAGIESKWVLPIVSRGDSSILAPERIDPIRVCGRLIPVASHKANGGVIYDFGANIAGRLSVTVCGERGAEITLVHAERLTADGDVNTLNLRSARATDRYVLKGEKTCETYSPRFTYHGFQFAKIITKGNVTVKSVVAERLHSDVDLIGEFSCSDEKLNYLHEIAVRTEQNNQFGVLTDCPQRDERFGWLNDLGARLYQTVYNFDMSRFFPKVVADISDGQLPGGEIGDTAPYYVGGRPADPVSVAYLLMPYYSYVYYGDDSVAKREYSNLKRWVDYLLSRTENGIVTYSYYGDWVFPTCFGKSADKLFVSTISLYWHLLVMIKIAKIVGEKSDEKYYAERSEEVKNAINAKYYDPAKKSYACGAQTENSMSLTLNVAPERDRAAIAENVAKDVIAKNYHSTCGNVGYRHLFYVLGEFGYQDLAVKILENPEYPGWGYMVANGATSVWERWESEMSDEMDSFDHPMFGSYDAFFYAFLGGITVDDDAFACDKITIAPVKPSGMTCVNCSLNTIRGKVVSNWKEDEETTVYHVEIPFGITARFKAEGVEKTLTHGVYNIKI